MFKDKQLHRGLSDLVTRFVEFLDAYNLSVKATNNNFQQLNDQVTTGLEKLEKLQRTAFDSADRGIAHSNQIAEVYTLVKGLDLFQREVLWYEDNTKKLEAERDLLQADNAKLQQRIEDLTDYAAQCDVAIHNQSLEIKNLQDSVNSTSSNLADALSRNQELQVAIDYAHNINKQPVEYAQQQPIVVNNQFNMQELASELSKYLNPNPVGDSRLQPATKQQFEPFENSTPVHTHESNAAEFFRQDSQRVQRQESKVVEPLANLVVPGNGLRTSADYIPSPGQEEPDEIVVEQLVFTDPAIAQRLQTAPSGPVLLPSERQRALQLAELGAVGVLQQNQNG